MTKKEATTPAIVEETELALVPQGGWGVAETLTVNDYTMPRLMLMQGLSDLVSKGAAAPGEFVDSVTGESLGRSVDLIIFGLQKSWVYLGIGSPPKFLGEEAITPNNDTKPYEVTYNGEAATCNRTYKYYALVVGKEDELPYVVRLNRSSRKSGDQLNTVFGRMQSRGKSSASAIVRMTSVAEKNDKGTFQVPTFQVVGESTQKQQALAYKGYQLLNSGVLVEDKPEEREVAPVVDIHDDDIPF